MCVYVCVKKSEIKRKKEKEKRSPVNDLVQEFSFLFSILFYLVTIEYWFVTENLIYVIRRNTNFT